MSTPSPGGWLELARGAAAAAGADDEVRERTGLIGFALGDTTYAVPVESVREIVRMRPITPIPRVGRAVRGVISLRGEIVQVVDLRLRLQLPAIEPTRASRILVVHAGDGCIAGLLVDAVREVLRVDPGEILPVAAGDTIAVEGLCARGAEFVSLLSLERVFEIDDQG